MTQHYNITSTNLRSAIGCSPSSLWAWTRGLPREREWSHTGRGKGSSTPDRFRLSDIVVALRQNRRVGLSGDDLLCVVDLLDTSIDDPATPLEDAGHRAAALMACLSDVEKERFSRVVRWARDGATFVLWTSAHLINDRDLGTLILRPAVLVYVLTGQQHHNFPTTREVWGNYVGQHVEANVDGTTIE